jgi:hypothetical protein
MAISASSVASSSTLNTLRTQFNNLVTDVAAIEGGSITYTTLNTTTTNATTLNVKEDGTIVFEGATDDAYETTLTVTDPTADRTITFPNETGTVFTSGGAIALGGNITKASDLTVDVEGDISLDANGGDVYLKDNGTIYGTLTNNSGNLTIKNSSAEVAAITIDGDEVVTFADDILIKDGGTIGNASVADVLTLASTGIVTLKDDLIIKDGGTIGVTSAATAITIASTGIVTFVDDIIIKDAGTIGSASDTDAIAISSAGVVSLSATTEASATGTAALTVAGGLGVAKDVWIGDDVVLDSDSAVLKFGDDQDTTLTHTDGTGLTLNSTNKLTFGDAASFVQQSSDGTLRIDGEAIIDLNASTRVDVSTDLTVGDDISLASDSAVIHFGGDSEVTLTHVADTGLTLTHTATGDDKPIVLNLKSEEDAIIADEEIGRIDFTAGDDSGTDAILTAASIAAVAEDTFAADNNSTGLAFKLGVSAAATEMFRMDHDGDFKIKTDGSAIGFGANNEIELTHVHDTGLLLTDSGGSPTLQLHDSNESVSSDGSNLKLTSGGTTFTFPSSDGSSGHFLKTNASGVLSFAAASISSLACDDLSEGDAAVTISTSSGNITIDATADDSDIIFKGTDGTADTTFLTIDGSDAGTLIANNDLELGTDSSQILFGADNEITLAHVADTGLTLTHTAATDNTPIVLNLKSEEDAIIADEEIGRIDFTAGDSSGTDAILTAASIAAVAEDTFAADNNSTGLAFKLGVSAAATEMFRMDHDGDFKIITDGSAIAFGANNEIELTHVHDTGLLLTDSGGTPTLQLHDSNESIASDGSKVILTSGGTAFNMPTADGDADQVLTTDGSGTLSFATASGGIGAGKAIVFAMIFGK